MTWGEASSEEIGHWQIDNSLDYGINFLDTAEMYPTNPMRRNTAGKTEEIIGNWIEKNRGTRDKLILATKITGEGCKTVRNGDPISKSQLIKSVEDSLKRLKTDYIDLYQLHWPNRGSYHFRKYWNFDATNQSTNELNDHVHDIIETISKLINNGKIRTFGLSNESAWGTMKFLEASGEKPEARIVSIQNEYSLLCRLFDTDLAELCHHENVQLLAFSPLGAGLLTGKYQNRSIPDGSRLKVTPSLGDRIGLNTFETTERYLKVAKKHNIDPIHMSLSFCASRPFIGSVIFGATTKKQLTHILNGIDKTLSSENLEDINKINREKPMPI
jgi:aryl-alcohol dehydrogenase-like predicted oxidoreductase